MKRIFIAFLATLMVMAISHGTAQAQVNLNGCVGTCAQSYTNSDIAPQTRIYNFRASSNLCGSHTSFAIIKVNGKLKYSGPIENNSSIYFDAEAGHTIAVHVGIFRSDPLQSCIFLGETYFDIY